MAIAKSRRWWLGKALIFFGLLLVIGLVYFYYAYHIRPLRPGFEEYKPTQLPSGIATTNTQYSAPITNQDIDSFGAFIAPVYYMTLVINLSLTNSWISEYAYSGDLNSWCAQEYGTTGTCATYQTALHQPYLNGVVLASKQIVQDVYFHKNNTAIWMTLRGYPTKISQASWSNIIDSFQPTHYNPSHVDISGAGD
jgi:hypothetical protein